MRSKDYGVVVTQHVYSVMLDLFGYDAAALTPLVMEGSEEASTQLGDYVYRIVWEIARWFNEGQWGELQTGLAALPECVNHEGLGLDLLLGVQLNINTMNKHPSRAGVKKIHSLERLLARAQAQCEVHRLWEENTPSKKQGFADALGALATMISKAAST